MINVYTEKQKDEWDSIVKSFERYDVYYLSGYTKAFETHGDGEANLLYYTSENLRGINVIMKRDVSEDNNFLEKIEKNKFFDIVTPYGYGGWLFEGEQHEESIEKFCSEYKKWCDESGIISEFVRFNPVLDNVSGICEKVYDTTALGNTVAILLDDKEKIWDRFSSKNRGHIRAAIKAGVTVKIDNSEDMFEIFRDIYNTTMDRDEAKSYYYFQKDFFESIKNDLKNNATLFTAYLGEKPIASSIMIFANGYMNYHLSGQLYEYRKYSGTSLILYEAAKWGCERGYKWLHLGGGLGAQEGPLYDFKKSFYKKGEDKVFHTGKNIYNQKAYDYLVGLRDEELSENYFPRYRA